MDEIGSLLGGRYRLLRRLGQGAMSVVYEGEDQTLGRRVAVKLLLPHLAASAEARGRFRREANAVARLDHPQIVSIFDFAGEEATEAYLVMELIKGRTLAELLQAMPLPVPEAALLFGVPVATALAHAHQAGVMHRDLKPENVMVSDDGQVKLMDFGIARLADASTLTTTGAILGSPAYMAPEYIEAEPADERADIFSFGAILYRLVTGRLPFEAPTPAALFKRIVEGVTTDPRRLNPRVSEPLRACIAKAMALRPAERHQSAPELVVELQALLAGVGVEASDQQRALLLAGPAVYQAALAERIADDSLARAARPGLGIGAALDLYDRVLAYRPDDPAALAGVERLHRARRWRARWRQARRVGLAATLALALAAGAHEWLPRLTAPDPAASAAPEGASLAPQVAAERPGGDGGSQAVASTTAVVPGRNGGLQPVRPPRGQTGGDARSEASAPATPVTVRIHARPYASIWVDDRLVARDAMQPIELALTPGEHALRFEHPASHVLRETVLVPADAAITPEFRYDLQPRPARLLVNATDGTVVEVGRQRHLVNPLTRDEGILVELPEYRWQLAVRVLRPGRPPLIRDVQFLAGDTVRLDLADDASN